MVVVNEVVGARSSLAWPASQRGPDRRLRRRPAQRRRRCARCEACGRDAGRSRRGGRWRQPLRRRSRRPASSTSRAASTGRRPCGSRACRRTRAQRSMCAASRSGARPSARPSTRCGRASTLLEAEGLQAEVVTGAGTGTYLFEAASGVYNELQPGSYVFMDADYGRNLDRDGQPVHTFEQSLFVLATVMSHPAWPRRRRRGAEGPQRGFRDAARRRCSRRPPHARIRRTRRDRARWTRQCQLGQKIRLIPGHCDPTVNLYDWLVCFRGDRVEAIWPITARGAFY